MANNHPVILAHGILGFGPKELGRLNYWESALKVSTSLPRYEASVGPLSSAHDRACEMAAQIRGTKVDYGKQHSKEHGHRQHGYDFANDPFVPNWSESNPVHLVGHSLGSPTVRCLQHLLEIDHFGWGSNHRWVRSISTISGVTNGSTLVYFFGVDKKTGQLKKSRRTIPLLRLIEVFTSATGGVLDSIYNFDLDHWGFERKTGESFLDYMARVAESDFLWGKDNAVYTLSLQGAHHDNGVWKTYSDTNYFSYITEQTTKGWFSDRYYPQFLMNPALLAPATYMGQKIFDPAPIPVSNFDSTEWWENDGAVSTHSQKFPHTNGTHPVGGEFQDETSPESFETGKWYYKWERGMDHTDICVFPQLTQIGRQRKFYESLFRRLSGI